MTNHPMVDDIVDSLDDPLAFAAEAVESCVVEMARPSPLVAASYRSLRNAVVDTRVVVRSVDASCCWDETFVGRWRNRDASAVVAFAFAWGGIDSVVGS